MEFVEQTVAWVGGVLLKFGQLGDELVALGFCQHLNAGNEAVFIVRLELYSMCC